MFRKLTADEIDVRVAMVKDKGVSLLLYKDARADMNILDETVGAYNWKREHRRDNANCIVSIYDANKNEWIGKEDTGTESYTEKEKGLASDSFKRACFNWGIGRELYTAPFIWIPRDKVKIQNKNGKLTTYDKFSVKKIAYDEKGTINELVIANDKGDIVFKKTMHNNQSKAQKQPQNTNNFIDKKQVATLQALIKQYNTDVSKMLKFFDVANLESMTQAQFKKAIEVIKK